MCTVTYLPDSDNNFILTSSRDEKSSRLPALPPAVYKLGDKDVLFPKDKAAGGTWIAMDRQGKVACLLNGAFQAHIPSPPYKKSRGLVVLDAFSYKSMEDFFKNYDFVDIEPFTMIVYFNSLYEFRWDGENRHIKMHDKNKAHIWSSATLYSQEVIAKRETWFTKWLEKGNAIDPEEIRYFHHFAGEGDFENAIKVNRGSLYTVSITSIIQKKSESSMVYEDLVNNESYTAII